VADQCNLCSSHKANLLNCSAELLSSKDKPGWSHLCSVDEGTVVTKSNTCIVIIPRMLVYKLHLLTWDSALLKKMLKMHSKLTNTPEDST